MARRHRRANAPIQAAPGEPDEQERQIIDALAALRDTSVREVMTPRVDVIALRAPVNVDDVQRAVKESGHSRFPVYEGDLDHVAGVLFIKDLFRMEAPTPDAIIRRLRKPFLVPEHRRVLEVLGEMRQRRYAFAMVLDEYGGIEGVLTIKDLVSELVGDLRDEFDRPEEAGIVRVDAERWLVEGACAVDRVNDELGLDLPEGEYVTLGGFILERLGRIPEEGDEVVHGDSRLRVTAMDRRRVAKVVVRAASATIDGTGK